VVLLYFIRRKFTTVLKKKYEKPPFPDGKAFEQTQMLRISPRANSFCNSLLAPSKQQTKVRKENLPRTHKKNRPLSGRIPYAKTAAAAAGDELEKNLHIFFFSSERRRRCRCRWCAERLKHLSHSFER
jgi:hypothetical protein